jgi:heme-degrading monooxygenase HmoA
VASLKQRNREGPLGVGKLVGESGLGEVESSRRRGQRALVGHREEESEVANLEASRKPVHVMSITNSCLANNSLPECLPSGYLVSRGWRMVVVLFFSKLTAEAGEEYVATDQRLMEKAGSAPGFVGAKGFTAADGERLTIVRWKDLETLRAWREDPEHRAAQAEGRGLWYQYYDMEVAEVVRESHFERSPAHRAE